MLALLIIIGLPWLWNTLRLVAYHEAPPKGTVEGLDYALLCINMNPACGTDY